MIDWGEIRLKSRFGIVQIQLLRREANEIADFSYYKMTKHRRECISIALARLDRLNEFGVKSDLELMVVLRNNKVELRPDLYEKYNSLSDTELIMTVIDYPKQDFSILMSAS
ncbi:hypothetical protein PQO01_06995 [Lentisphaera marina]|uniref:hypothetical protein n=1 Tax=Lentisphaera marina TaxID=1111041 RepID=UPI002367093A|nr:hypothetical protein [Lentisphaera marina]MDD7984693.1 hypothetical protein [Lentisphaera marina]